jgi:GntR family transcriptional repressor for pyruvate dehydrogenase complex
MQNGGQRPDGQTAASIVADHLAQMILGELSPGSTLPSEADLAARYDVSRLTIREAVKRLEGRGLLVIARGRKAVVREPDSAAFTDFLTSVIRYDPKGLFDLVAVRLSLEVQSANLAAKHATRASVAAIESELQGMRDTLLGGDRLSSPETESSFHSHDVGFHEAIALASGNRVLGYLFEAMSKPLREAFFISRRGHEQRGQTPADIVAAHQRILDAIRLGNDRAAGEAMRLHLKNTERDIRIALRQLASPSTSRD